MAETEKRKRGNPNFAKKKGEEGYVPRNTDAAHEAATKSHSIFESADEFSAVAAAYFEVCDAEYEKYSESGLCLFLSKHNNKGRNITLQTLHKWYDGEACEHLQEVVQMAYLRIQHQIETDPRYDDKGMSAYRIFLEKQSRLGGKTDKTEAKQDVKVELSVKDYDPEFFK